MKRLILLTSILLFATSTFASSNDSLYSYRNGQYLKAAPGLTQLAKKNNKVALYYLGLMSINGYGKAQNLQRGVAFITRSAKEGYLPAQLFVAKYYLKNNNPAAALPWFKKAAEKNNLDAQMFTSAAYLYGYGVKRNLNVAKRYIIQAAKNGDSLAQYTLATNFLKSKHRVNKKLGLIWLKKSARKGYTPAQLTLASMYYHGKNTSKNKTKASLWVDKATQNKNTKTDYQLGKFYQSVNKEKALQFLQKASEADNPKAQLMLGKLLLSKTDPQGKQDKQGVLWILKAAQHGNLMAQKQLASMYKKGIGVEKNEQLAEQWLLKAKNERKTNAKKITKQQVMPWLSSGSYQLVGVLPAPNKAKQQIIYNMSPKLSTIKRAQVFKEKASITNPNEVNVSAFINVIGALNYQKKQARLLIPEYALPKTDNEQALFTKTANEAMHGYAKSQFILGMMYERGVGVDKNEQKAKYWYEKSAKQNYLRAEYNLGVLYLEGSGVNKNYKQALAWLEKAAFKGDSNAQYLLALLHEYGLGTWGDKSYISQNIQYASNMYHLAASNNNPKAQFNLAELYASGLLGKGRTIKSQKALYDLSLKLYESAAKKGVPSAKVALAYYYVESQNPEKQKWAFEVASKAASQADGGVNPNAALILAIMYDRGIGTSRDKSDAIDWYEKSVAAGNPVAQFILGTYYYMGEGVRRNTSKATALLTQASKNNLAYADYNLAVIKHDQDPQSNFLPLLRKAADKQYSKASLLLADNYLAHPDHYNHLKDAAKIYLKLARIGYADAQLRLGYMYERGIVFNSNAKQAAFWYKKSASQNNITAQYLLANMYQTGRLGRPNMDKATRWYERAAKQHFIPAKLALGFINEKHYHDDKKAFNWYQNILETDRKNTLAQYNLALMYEHGKGVDLNYRKARKLFIKAADKDFAPAQYALANIYLQGLGVRKNPRKAIKWLNKAAKLDYAYAIYQLGALNEAGSGTRANLNKAMTYYKKAAEEGNPQARLALKRLLLPSEKQQ